MSESGVPAGPFPLDISRYRFLGGTRPDHDGAGLLGAKAHVAGGAVDAKGSPASSVTTWSLAPATARSRTRR